MPLDFTEAMKYLNGYLADLRSRGEEIPLLAENAYAEYLRALTALQVLVQRYTTPEQNGSFPLLHPEERRELAAAYGNVLKSGGACLGIIGGKNPVMPECARRITFLNSRLIKDLNALNHVGPTERVSLPEIAGRAKSLNLKLPDEANLDSVHGNSSERTPVSFVDSAGKKRYGFFTPQKVVISPLEEIERRIAELKKINRRFGDGIDKYIHDPINTSAPGAITMVGAVYEFDRNVATMLRSFQDKDNPFTWDEISVMSNNERLLAKIDELYAYCKEVQTADTQYTVGLGLDPSLSRRVDSRNSAMSSMANLLGISDLLADSRPATLTRNGQTVEGTFTETAEGVDMRTIRPDNPAAGYRSVNDPERAWMRDYLDIQILDFLCQNVDRHRENLILQFDYTNPERPRLVGLKGIDNDYSFGALNPNKPSDMLSGLTDINYITPYMKSVIESLDPSEVRSALAGYDLKPDEIEAACERTRLLKAKLPSMTVLRDGDWTALSKKALKPDESGKSRIVFDSLYEMNIPETLRVRNGKVEAPPVYTDAEIAADPGQNRFMAELDRIEALDRLSYENQHWYLIYAKPQYKQMRNAIGRLKETMARIGGEPTGEKIADLAENLEDMKLWAEGYLMVKGEPDGSRAEGRVHAAKEVLKYTREILPKVYDQLNASQVDIGKQMETRAQSGRSKIISHLHGQRTDSAVLKDAFADLCLDALIKQARVNAREAGRKGLTGMELGMMKFGASAVWKSLEKSPAVAEVKARLFPRGKVCNPELLMFMDSNDLGKTGAQVLAENILSGVNTDAAIKQIKETSVTRAIERSGRVL